MDNLVIPVVMWGSRPPTHKICCIVVTRNLSHIITGCMDGQLVIWEVSEDQRNMLPKMMMFGHSGSIISIAPISSQSSDENTKYFISASSNNELCLWNLADGCCLEQTKLAGSPTHLVAFEMETNGILEPFVLCYGFFAEIFLLSTNSLDILCTLVSRIYPDWMSSCCVIRSNEETSVIGLTMSGTIKVWHLTDISSGSSSVLEDESKQLRCQNAIGLRHLSVPVNLLLVLLPLEWQLYDGGDFSLLCRTDKPSKSPLSGGDFLTNGRVVMWDEEGVCYLYHLSIGHTGQEKYKEDVRIYSSTKPKLLYSFSSKTPGRYPLPPVIQLVHSSHSELKSLLVSGDGDGKVWLWELKDSPGSICKISVVLKSSNSLLQHWEGLSKKPAGVIDKLMKTEVPDLVTTSLYLEGIGQLACGREDGSIILVQVAKTCVSHLLQGDQHMKRGTIPHITLRGHRDRITCLLYPHQECTRYPAQLFVSGGADFSVILWEIFTGEQVHVFNVHGGEITQLLVPPDNCSPRIQQSICSVSCDNSVALLSVKERKHVMFASRHTSKVRTIKWRPSDDFMMVYCFDGALFVWQMETGHLDRFVTGLMAVEALDACSERPNNRSDSVAQGPFNLSQAFKRHSLAGFKAVAQQGIKSILETFEDKLQQAELEQSDVNMVASGKALLVKPVRACPTQDHDSHVLFFNTETIISTLLQEKALQEKIMQKHASTNNGEELNPAKKVINAVISQMKNQLLDSGNQTLPVLTSSFTQRKGKKGGHRCMEIGSVMNIARLLLSCLHGWGLDEKLDSICKQQLGLREPIVPICFGLLSREGQTALMLPTQVGDSDNCSTAIMEISSTRHLEALSFSSHWGISSLLTTRHLIAIISVANTMMELSGFGLQGIKPSALMLNEEYDNETSTSSTSESCASNSNEIEGVKQGWSVLATMYCVLLPELLGPFSYKPPEMELLARRWQDRCLEVREAAQALLLAKLRQLNTDQRREIVQDWAQHMPDYIQRQHVDLIPNTRTGESSAGARLDDVGAVSGHCSSELGTEVSLLQPVAQRSSYESRRRQATAVVILGVIGAEFGHEMGPSMCATPLKSVYNTSAPDVFDLSEYSLARNTCKALVYLLLQPASPQLPAHAPIRRAAIDLLGRGFTVWEPYIEVSAVLLGLLELCVDYGVHFASIQSGLPLSAKADSCRSSHHALCLIASVRPLTFITTIAREVTRHNAAAANPQHQALLSTSIIVRSKAEILRIVELLADKMLRNVMELLIEFMDIVLFCIDTTALCSSQSLAETVPALSRFRMISYDPHTKRIAVGTRQGVIHLYDLRSNKHQEVSRGRCAISALSFSPEGKYLAVYSVQDNHLSFWITSSSLFGMLQPQVKCVKTVRPLPPAIFQSLSTCNVNVDFAKLSLQLRWINNRSAVLLFSDGTEYRCHV